MRVKITWPAGSPDQGNPAQRAFAARDDLTLTGRTNSTVSPHDVLVEVHSVSSVWCERMRFFRMGSLTPLDDTARVFLSTLRLAGRS